LVNIWGTIRETTICEREEDMANLPKRSETHDQEARSLAKLSNVLPGGLFLLRNEGGADGGSDYGVDRVLELRQETQYLTNLRAQLQMKSVRDASRNQDGSFSYAVPIPSLNYLRNQPNSIYVVYLENEDRLVWEQVDVICQTAELPPNSIDLATTDQQTFSYRFNKPLDNHAFSEIHATVLHRGQVIRNVSEFLSVASSSEQSNAAVLLKNGKLSKIDEIIANLKAGGVSLVNSGGVSIVNEAIDNLPPTYIKGDPEISLICAYVKFQLGLCYDALSWLPKGQARERLSPNDKVLASFIELNLQFSCGTVSAEQYVDKIAIIEQENPESILGLQLKLERIRRSIPLKGVEGLKAALKEAETTLNALLVHSEASLPIKISAEITKWELEGWQLFYRVSEQAGITRMRFRLGFPLPYEERLEGAQQLFFRLKGWMDRYSDLRKRTEDNPVEYGRVVIIASTLMLRSIAERRIDASAIPEDISVINEVKSFASSIYEQLTGAGLHHLAHKARLLEAEALEGLGEQQQARDIAKAIHQTSQELGLLDIQQLVEQFLAGEGIFSSAGKIHTELSGSRDDSLRKTSEEAAKRMANIFVESLGLPETSRENVLKEFAWLKKDAESRYTFCRHICTLQNLNHGKIRETMYSIDPPRIIRCEKYGFCSDIPGTDRTSLLGLFFMNYCNKLSCKEPTCSDSCFCQK